MAALLVPPAATIVSFTVPLAATRGVTTVISVADTKRALVPAVLPNRTDFTPMKFVPRRVIVVPPLCVPRAGVKTG